MHTTGAAPGLSVVVVTLGGRSHLPRWIGPLLYVIAEKPLDAWSNGGQRR